MKIAMMSAWNEDSGASVHAELIGRAWVEMGHVLKVFSFFPADFHGTAIVNKDENYVTRCFTTSKSEHPYFDPRPILGADFDIFVTQDLGMLPKDGLGKIFHHIKRKASTVTVIHDREPSDDPSFYQYDWDRLVCFDNRYKAFLEKYYPEEKISIIPFPCMPLQRGDKKEARAKLGLPREKKIVLIFGQRIREHLPLIPLIKDVAAQIPCMLLVVTKKDIELLNGIDGLELEIRKESPSLDRLYDYLHASDVLIVRREPCQGVVVSSTVYQCLGAGCPILASDNNFFETLKEVVMTFSDTSQFKTKLADILTKKECYDAKRRALPIFLESNSAQSVAKRYLELFETLLYQRNAEATYQLMQAPLYLKSGDAGFVQNPLQTEAVSSHGLSSQNPFTTMSKGGGCTIPPDSIPGR